MAQNLLSICLLVVLVTGQTFFHKISLTITSLKIWCNLRHSILCEFRYQMHTPSLVQNLFNCQARRRAIVGSLSWNTFFSIRAKGFCFGQNWLESTCFTLFNKTISPRLFFTILVKSHVIIRVF